MTQGGEADASPRVPATSRQLRAWARAGNVGDRQRGKGGQHVTPKKRVDWSWLATCGRASSVFPGGAAAERLAVLPPRVVCLVGISAESRQRRLLSARSLEPSRGRRPRFPHPTRRKTTGRSGRMRRRLRGAVGLTDVPLVSLDPVCTGALDLMQGNVGWMQEGKRSGRGGKVGIGAQREDGRPFWRREGVGTSNHIDNGDTWARAVTSVGTCDPAETAAESCGSRYRTRLRCTCKGG